MSKSPKIRPFVCNYRWVICSLLFCATVINYMDRQILGLLAPLLQKDIGWTELEYGHLVTAFQAAYALGLLGFSRFVDRVGTKLGYVFCIVWWSFAAMGHALARTVFGFGVARFALGLGESGNFPTAIKVVAEWFPQKERALATGIFNCGSNVGALIAPLVVPWLALNYGWRAAFVVLGTLGFVWLVFWFIFYDSPAQSSRLGVTEREYIDSSLEPGESDVSSFQWKNLFRHRALWAYLINGVLTSPVWWFYLYWLPKFLNTQFGLNLTQMGLPLVTIYGLTCVGSIGGGWVSSALIARGFSVNLSRKLVLAFCAVCAIPVIFITHAPNVWAATLILALAAAANQGWSANMYTFVSDIFPKKAVASVVGLGSMAGSLSSMAFSEASGYLLQKTGNYTLLFVVCGSAYVLSISIVHLMVPKMNPVKLD